MDEEGGGLALGIGGTQRGSSGGWRFDKQLLLALCLL